MTRVLIGNVSTNDSAEHAWENFGEVRAALAGSRLQNVRMQMGVLNRRRDDVRSARGQSLLSDVSAVGFDGRLYDLGPFSICLCVKNLIAHPTLDAPDPAIESPTLLHG